MEFREFNKKDLLCNVEAFCNLYNRVFTAKVNTEIIIQRYIENPYDDLLMNVAMERGRIIANYSAVPIRVRVDGRIRKAALGINTMADPDYQGDGLPLLLAKELYPKMREKGYSMVLGFPNHLSHYMFRGILGGKTVYEIPTMKLLVSDYCGRREKTIDSGVLGQQELNASLIPERVYFDLSWDYLKWRYIGNKEKNYDLLILDNENWLIFNRYNKELNITELNCGELPKAKKLVREVITIGIDEGFECITTWEKTNTKMHSYLEQLGFKLSAPIRYFGVTCFDESLSDIVEDYRNWRIHMGNDNVY